MKEIKNDGIELIRLLAIAILILYHSALIGGNTKIISAGGVYNIPLLIFSALSSHVAWVGTDILLAIAGYLCVISIYKRKLSNENYFQYLLNRGIRIIPSYYLFLIFYLYIGVPVINNLGQYFALKKGFEFSLWTFISSFYFSNSEWRWSGVALEGMFSLSIVVQLFILLGFILFVIKDNYKILLILMAFELVAIGLRFYLGAEDHWKTYFFTFTRMDAFLFGMITAILNQIDIVNKYLSTNAKKLFYIFLAIFIAMGIITKGLAHGKLTTYISYPIIALFSGALINLTVHYKLKNKLLLAISRKGKLTYAVYLFKLPVVYLVHSILLLFFNELDTTGKIIIFFITSFSACFIFAYIWWLLVERPITYLITKLIHVLEIKR